MFLLMLVLHIKHHCELKSNDQDMFHLIVLMLIHSRQIEILTLEFVFLNYILLVLLFYYIYLLVVLVVLIELANFVSYI